MATIQDIKQRAQQVKDATQVGENTANRVGGVLVDLCDYDKETRDGLPVIATAEDFNNPTQQQAAKVPTVGAILGCMDEVPTSLSNKPVKSGGVKTMIDAVGDKIAEFDMVGVGNPSVFSRNYPVLAEHTYRLYVKNPNIDKSQVSVSSSSTYTFRVTGEVNGSVVKTFASQTTANKTKPLNNFYDIAIADTGAESIKIEMRASTGEQQVFLLEDITFAKEQSEASEQRDIELKDSLINCQKNSEICSTVVYSDVAANTNCFKVVDCKIKDGSKVLVRIKTSVDIVISSLRLTSAISVSSGTITPIFVGNNDTREADKYYYYEKECTGNEYLLCAVFKTDLSSEDNVTIDVVNLSAMSDCVSELGGTIAHDNMLNKTVQSFSLSGGSTVAANNLFKQANHEMAITLTSNYTCVCVFALSTGTTAGTIIDATKTKMSLTAGVPKTIRITPSVAWSRFFLVNSVIVDSGSPYTADEVVLTCSAVDLNENSIDANALATTILEGSDMWSNVELVDGYVIYRGALRQMSSNAYHYCRPISVKRGDIIYGTGNTLAADYKYVWETDAQSSYFRPIGIMWRSNSDAFYVAQEDGYITFNLRNTYNMHWYRLPVLKEMLDTDLYQKQDYAYPEIVPMLRNLSYNSINDEGKRMEKPVTLLHFSDIHGGARNLAKIKNFYNRYKPYISDVICTGDMVAGKFPDWNASLWGQDFVKKFLLAIGNHDVYDSADHFDGLDGGYDNVAYRATNAEKYAQYFANVAEWGVTQPAGAEEQGLCYYHKDYDTTTDAQVSTSVNKLRLIVLDCSETKEEVAAGTTGASYNEDDGKYYVNHYSFDAAQLAWFTNLLTEAKTNNYAVVVAQHYPLTTTTGSNLVLFDTPFNSLMSAARFNHINAIPGALEAVDDFIEAGGHFVCWICGHRHADHLAMEKNHSHQIYINVGSANDSAVGIDSDKGVPYVTDQFNIMSIDVRKRLLTLYRIGSHVDKWGRHRECIVIDYANKTILTQY